MTKTQKLITALAALSLAVGLSACATQEGDVERAEQVVEFTAILNDGTQVPCMRIHGFYGFDCNWDKAVRTDKVTP